MRHERSYDRAHRKVVQTKTKKHRSLGASDELLEALQALRKDRLEAWFGRNKTALVDAGLWDETVKLPKVIFCNEDGRYMDRVNLVDRHYFRSLQAAGFKRRRYHKLRHCYATALLSLGADDKYVQGQLGHSSITLTKDLYGQTYEGKFNWHRWIDELFPLLTKAVEPKSSEATK